MIPPRSSFDTTRAVRYLDQQQRTAVTQPTYLPSASDLQDFTEGKASTAYNWLGAHAHPSGGFAFALWAPRAQAVAVIGDFNHWQPQPLGQQGEFWVGTIAEAEAGQLYKFKVVGCDGAEQDRADPYARAAEYRPGTASVLVGPVDYQWRDDAWMAKRAGQDPRLRPVAIYELHLGSWIRRDGQAPGYRALAQPLIHHVHQYGLTHVEFMPVMEHPYDPSWGYQVTGYFAPTSRWGTPDDLRFLIDALHHAGIGVILDWVPAHFPRDVHALQRLDGAPLYEHPDPQRGEQPDWGTLIFDYGRPEVQSFLLSSARYWLQEFHADGLRFDAVASMLYLDYSRGPGQWQPNVHGGNWNLEAIQCLQALTALTEVVQPGAMCIAEESTAFPGVTRSVADGGLGFTLKWSMGWMHDTLAFLEADPLVRSSLHDRWTFSTTYAHAEAFVLPLSHDEVVHGKRPLVHKLGGANEYALVQLRLLFGWQWLHPGKKLIFMGDELAEHREWNHDGEIDWSLLTRPDRRQLRAWLAALGHLYRTQPAMWSDADPAGFAWVEGSNSHESIVIFERRLTNQLAADPAAATGADPVWQRLVCVLHATPVARKGQWLPMPALGKWRLVLASDDLEFGGQRPPRGRSYVASTQWGRPQLKCDLPPFGVLVFASTERDAGLGAP